MSLARHLAELKKKHAALSAEIKAEERRPGVCSTHIRALKKQKLRLKEEIQRKSAGDDEAGQVATNPVAPRKPGGAADFRLVHDKEPRVGDNEPRGVGEQVFHEQQLAGTLG